MTKPFNRLKAADGIWWKYVHRSERIEKHMIRCGGTTKWLTNDEIGDLIKNSQKIES